MLTYALQLITALYARKTDNAGLPSVLHPMRVYQRVCQFEHVFEYTYSEALPVIALLHDVREDFGIALSECEAFTARVLNGVDALTRWPGEGYFDYIDRVCQDPLACLVKVADICDNLTRRGFRLSLRGRYISSAAKLLQALEDHDEILTRDYITARNMITEATRASS